MSWRKHFTVYDQANYRGRAENSMGAFNNKYSSWLPDVYTGPPNRLERYMQYDQMDQDSEVNAALDIISEFCTQSSSDTELPYEIHFKKDGGVRSKTDPLHLSTIYSFLRTVRIL